MGIGIQVVFSGRSLLAVEGKVTQQIEVSFLVEGLHLLVPGFLYRASLPMRSLSVPTCLRPTSKLFEWN